MPSCFRPLAGFWFLKGGKFREEEYIYNGFPSPCGVLVLKTSIRMPIVSLEWSFRPLAGFWFLK